jgi:hypothetical protein
LVQGFGLVLTNLLDEVGSGFASMAKILLDEPIQINSTQVEAYCKYNLGV